jgi:hypothetical protein
MKACRLKVRLIMLVAAVCSLAGLGAGVAQAQSVTVSPTTLTFALPNGVTSSAQQTATFSVTGEGSVTVGTVGISGTNAGDFAIASDGCSGQKLTAPTACFVGVTFSGAMTTVENARLNFPNNVTEGTPFVALKGAAGAIKLFNSTFVAPSNPHATLSNPVTFGSVTLNLSCPTGEGPITGLLSSSPDGVGNVLDDNYVTLAVNGTTVNTGNNPAGNVCRGGPADQNGEIALNDCFTTSYQVPAGAGQLNGQDPDTFADAGNGILQNQGNATNAGGVPPIDISGFLPAGASKDTITLLDGGGFVAGASLFLKTNCTLAGVQTGGTITGNPITADNPASQAQNFSFDATQNQHIALSADYLALDGTEQIVAGTTPVPFDTGITQAQFATMVANTSAGPAVCMRLSGELAADGVTPLCKAFTLECTQPGVGTAAGMNCPQQLATNPRNLLFKVAFDTPDAIHLAPGTGPGLVMGQDNWASAGPGQTPNPQACSFNDAGDPLSGHLCPQDFLTQFIGGDPSSGGTGRTTNSTFVPVTNMPLPFTITLVTSENIFGWQNSTNSVTAKFFSSPAIYPIFNPLPANGFTPASIDSVTFGTTPATVPVPDTTFPVAGDITLFNPGGAGGASQCTPNAPGGIFTATDTINADTSTGNSFAEGRYKLHFFPTDCASTEGLKFTPQNSPVANWASFYTVPINIDLHAPTISVGTVTHSGNTVTIKYSCSDPDLLDGSEGSGVVICGTYLFFAVDSTPTLTSKFTVKTAHGVINLTTTDLAGNTFTDPVAF